MLRPAGSGYLAAAGVCAAIAALAWTLDPVLDNASLVLLFLLAVVLAAARYGRGPASLAAALAVLLFNLMFVPPRYSLAVADQRLLFTFSVMLGVGLLVAGLTAGLRAQAAAARERERQVRCLYELARTLGGALTVAQAAEALQDLLHAELGARCRLWRHDAADTPGDGAARAPADEATLPAWALQRLHAPGADADEAAFDDTGRVALLPLRATMALRGWLVVWRPPPAAAWLDDERRLLQACASLLAGALERIHYLDVAQASAVEIEGERLRSVLLAAVSHDLRTPLASLVGLAESLALTRPAPTPQQREIAESLAAGARRMGTMVDNLLDMARLQSGRVPLNLQWQPLEEVVGTALAAVPGLDHRPLDIHLPADLPLVRIDAVLVERLLVNLLENAVKYSPPGAAIEVQAMAEPAWLQLSVRDEGPGVPPSQAQDVFRMFERGHREGATPGVGLGLALCRAIVHAHGGTLQLEPRPGTGACFVVRLPRGEPPALPSDADLDADPVGGGAAP